MAYTYNKLLINDVEMYKKSKLGFINLIFFNWIILLNQQAQLDNINFSIV